MSDPTSDLDLLLSAAHELGLRVWFSGGEGRWEAAPGYEHQDAIDAIRGTIRSLTGAACRCVHKPDVNVRFGPRLVRRPDVALWCETPERNPRGTALTIPSAVVEILSEGYEKKDLDSPPFYLAHGVLDVILFDWRTGWVQHTTADGSTEHRSPHTMRLKMGCEITV